MKSILFMAINMNIGGMEKALLSMVSEISLQEYEVTILLLEEYGDFLTDIPNGINVEFIENYSKIKPELNNPPITLAIQYMKSKKFIRGFNILILHIITKFIKDRALYFRYVLKEYKVKDKQYDIAIAYAGPNDFISYFIVNKVKSLKKIQWIHFDVSKIGFNLKFSKKIYKKFDKIFIVSKEAKDKLDNLIPSIKDKTEVFSNLIPKKEILYKAQHGKSFNDDFDGIRILTVGRLSYEKGQDITIPILARLKSEGYNIRWYCIGDGNLRSKCEELIYKYNLEDDYVLLGLSKNPYPYMKDCDIYVQPSRHEGYCITLSEVRLFKKLIVSTNFTGASEQILNEETGLISSIDETDLYLSIKRLIDDFDLKNKIINNIN